MVTPSLDTSPVPGTTIEDVGTTVVPSTTSIPQVVLPSTVAPAATTIPQEDIRDVELRTARQRLAQVEADRQAETTQARLTEEARQVQRDALARGLSEEDANWMAQRHFTLAQGVHQEREKLREEQQYMQGKMNAAVQLGKEYGVSADLLMSGNTPQDMRAIGEREKRYATQEARIKALEQKQVPAQALDASNGSRAGGVVASGDTIDKLWVDYDRDHPGALNPYDAQYRKLVYG